MTPVEERVRAAGLLDGPVVVLLSGGRDSVCLLDVATRLASAVTAVHVDYGLRETAQADAEHCRTLCDELGVELHVHRPGEPRGNVQAWARRQRYAAARAHANGADVATGHTATDQVETVLYRLATSPGRRALLGIPDRDGDLVRPLLTITREETAEHNRARGLTWREDPTNESRAYARNRIRHEVLPALRAIHPAVEANILATLAYLRDEAAVLDSIELGDDVAELRTLPPALRRVSVQRRADEILALADGQRLDVGGGLRAIVEEGRLRFERTPARRVGGA
jgi:tRNA(Ile)-lysidine synthase